MNKCLSLLLFLPALLADSLEKEINHINSLLSEQKTVAARARIEDLLTVHPGHASLLYLLAFSLAESSEEGHKEEAVRLALEVVSRSSVSPRLYGNAANLALTVAHNSESSSLMLRASEQVVLRDRERPLPDPEGGEVRVFGLTLLGEQLLARGDTERAEQLLLSEAAPRQGDVSLGLLQLLLLRLQERRAGGGDRSRSDAHLLTIQPGHQQEMEEAQEMMKRIQEEWNKKRSTMSEEYDEILELLVVLGVYASKYQRPGWCEDDLSPSSLLTQHVSGGRVSWWPDLSGLWTSWDTRGPLSPTYRAGGRR